MLKGKIHKNTLFSLHLNNMMVIHSLSKMYLFFCIILKMQWSSRVVDSKKRKGLSTLKSTLIGYSTVSQEIILYTTSIQRPPLPCIIYKLTYLLLLKLTLHGMIKFSLVVKVSKAFDWTRIWAAGVVYFKKPSNENREKSLPFAELHSVNCCDEEYLFDKSCNRNIIDRPQHLLVMLTIGCMNKGWSIN